MRRYVWNILIAIDQLANTVFAGDPDETISSRIGKAIHYGEPGKISRILGAFLDWVDPGHTKSSIEYDEGNPVNKKEE